VSKLHKILWPRLLAEGVAIVVSILLAFWIQAWWDDRQQQNHEQVILASLLTELTTTQNRLRGIDSFAGGIRDSSARLLEAAVGPESQISDQEIDRLLGETTWYVPLGFLATPELDSLVNSDDLWLISNDQLKRMLRTWPQNLNIVRGPIQSDYYFFTESYLPYLHRNTSFQQIVNSATIQPGTGVEWPGTQIRMRESISHRGLLSDKYFQNLLSQRITWITEYLDFIPPGTQSELDEIVALIQIELGARLAD
jgi:hypothetical protein